MSIEIVRLRNLRLIKKLADYFTKKITLKVFFSSLTMASHFADFGDEAVLKSAEKGFQMALGEKLDRSIG